MHWNFPCFILFRNEAATTSPDRSKKQAMEKFRQLFKEVEDPRTSSATRHDFCKMLMIAVFSNLCGGQTCADMADCAENNEAFLRQFMRLEHGLPSHGAFARLSARSGRSASRKGERSPRPATAS